MTSKEIWLTTYFLAIARGDSSEDARDKAYQAVDDWEEFEADSA